MGTDAATAPKPAKKRLRHEFVLVFIWRDNPSAATVPGTTTTPSTTPASPEPPKGAPAPPPRAG
jgi:hypothetical protein